MPYTSYHLKSFLEPAVPPKRLFLMINMMPLKRCVVKGNYFTALLRNEVRNKFLISGPWLSLANLRPLSFAAARWRCLYLLLYRNGPLIRAIFDHFSLFWLILHHTDWSTHQKVSLFGQEPPQTVGSTPTWQTNSSLYARGSKGPLIMAILEHFFTFLT